VMAYGFLVAPHAHAGFPQEGHLSASLSLFLPGGDFVLAPHWRDMSLFDHCRPDNYSQAR
jgi:hypothetical protein